MALLRDGRIATAENLLAYESTILDVASTEGIELDRKLELAARALGVRITDFLLQNGTDVDKPRELSRVVVTEGLQQWHELQTLALLFRDAYSSQLNDRYAGKWKEYAAAADRAADLFFNTGVGMSADPVPAAATPECELINGGTLPPCTYTVQISWESESGREGGLSDPVVVEAAAGQLLRIRPTSIPNGVGGWNVYAGVSGGTLSRQNSTRLASQDWWVMPVSGLVIGSEPPPESTADYYVTRRRFFRG